MILGWNAWDFGIDKRKKKSEFDEFDFNDDEFDFDEDEFDFDEDEFDFDEDEFDFGD